jgi:hypothetical protein
MTANPAELRQQAQALLDEADRLEALVPRDRGELAELARRPPHARRAGRHRREDPRNQVEAERLHLRDALAALPPEAVTTADRAVTQAASAYAEALELVEERRAAMHDALRLRSWLSQAVVPRQVGGGWTTSLGAWKEGAPPPSLAAPVRFAAANGQTKELPLLDAFSALRADADRLDGIRADEAKRLARSQDDAVARAWNERAARQAAS